MREADKGFRVSGSHAHKYELRSIVTEDELHRFEQQHQIRLPEDYRAFLKEIGNGPAGPYYGLETLHEASLGRDLSKPFPFIKETEAYPEAELDTYGDREEYPGILEFCHQGCAIYAYLVVNGPTYGTIWDGREDFYPTGLTFGGWYRGWLEKSLRRLANERLIDKLEVGMSTEQVIAVVGGDWHERRTEHRIFFEASDMPAQLVLNEEGKVIEIRRWSRM